VVRGIFTAVLDFAQSLSLVPPPSLFFARFFTLPYSEEVPFPPAFSYSLLPNSRHLIEGFIFEFDVILLFANLPGPNKVLGRTTPFPSPLSPHFFHTPPPFLPPPSFSFLLPCSDRSLPHASTHLELSRPFGLLSFRNSMIFLVLGI